MDAILRQNSGGCQTSQDALKEAPWHLKQFAQDTPLRCPSNRQKTSDVTNIQYSID
jgi:hypothetical protein